MYATNLYQDSASILVTPSFNGPDNSTLIDIANSGNQIGLNMGDFFGLIRAVESFFLGKTGTIVAILLLILGFTLLMDFLLFAVPILFRLFEIFIAVAQLILGFIP